MIKLVLVSAVCIGEFLHACIPHQFEKIHKHSIVICAKHFAHLAPNAAACVILSVGLESAGRTF